MATRVFSALAAFAAFLSGCADEAVPEHSVRSYTDEVRIGPIIDGNMSYHGGPVMKSPNVYVIWYGNWGTNSSLQLVPEFVRGLAGSVWWDIITTYTDGSGSPIPNAINYRGSAFDSFSQGTFIADPPAVVRGVLDRGLQPVDANGIYYILGSTGVTFNGLCFPICGFHSSLGYGSTTLKFAIGADNLCGGCAPIQTTQSPNNNPGFDAMVNIMAHELAETVTDPIGNGWFSASGNENADLCAWQFPEMFTVGNGSVANAVLSTGKAYLLQANWVHSTLPEAHCAMRKTGLSSLVLFTTDATATVSPSSYHGVTSCGENQRCPIFYNTSTTVTVTATPKAGCTLNTASGCDSVSGNTCTLQLRDPAMQVMVGATCPPGPNCFDECFADCRSDGGTLAQCRRGCTAQCGG